MDIVAVNAWLQADGAYDAGRALLVTHGDPSEALLFTLECGDNVVSRRKLRAALADLVAEHIGRLRAQEPAERPHRPVAEPSEAPRIRAVGDLLPADRYPPILQQVRAEISQLYKEQAHLRARLPKTAKRADRYIMAARIMQTHHLIESRWQRLDHWRDFGHDLVPTKTTVDGATLQRRLTNLQSYKTRTGKRQPSEERIAEIDAEINQVKEQLHALRSS